MVEGTGGAGFIPAERTIRFVDPVNLIRVIPA